ncbi:multisubunit sodium/proton antiporter MrpB subunit [Halopolyspora algeriensis]|uniref:Multisubunit sodium/proton antiporter MrpB subunit n=1 Tax=Halopolyspora algeriensis TaxID=1500506 RepID=A0A368VQF6_9ACTN|nr:MnhB domain-containing protein [Halopolyspora algeriensis]RCW43728.1 multisubunit sodium/proton antiporter MrpB subunit [Halopolyspora algeriensis]TQM47489.1 multisubunit sodium/proton antiporter MrpB subunit [Halopolyspora algeriensis]
MTETESQSPGEQEAWTTWDTPSERWLLSGYTRDRRERKILLELAARILFPTVLVFSLYLLFAGHEHTGGGFSGGLVAGQAFVLRYLAGGRMDSSSTVSLQPPVLIGVGLTIATFISLVPLAFGGTVLESAIYTFTVPMLGQIKIVTSLFLDIGVYLLILGVVLDLLRTLGSAIEADVAAVERR